MEELEDFPDAEALLVQLLRPLLPGVTVKASLDVDGGKLPLLVINVGPPDELDPEQPDGYGYAYPVSLVSVDTSREKARRLALKAHKAIRGLDCTGQSIPGLGLVATVGNVLLPHRTATAELGGDSVTEFLAAYSVEALPS